MKSVNLLIILLGCFLFGAIGSPVSTDGHIHDKRGLEVTNGDEIILVNTHTGAKKDIAAISESDQTWIEKHTTKMKSRNIPFLSAIHAYYNYDPLGKGNKPIAKAEVHFWPPKDENKQQQEIMKTKLDAAKIEWKKTDAYKNLKQYLDELSKDVEVSKIIGLGCGSLDGLNPFSEASQTRNRGRSYIQLAAVLTMQEDLKSGPEVILQDPTYGDNEIDFMTKSGSSGGVQVTNDPDAFDAIDEKTIFFNIGGYEGFWYRIENGPTPVAIITDSLDTTIGNRPMLKPQSDLLEKYTDPQEVAPAGTEGLGRHPTKFWTRACN
ncbi:hypothetical protein N7474_005940 [Penicillium riverlandense]|uniref:uncharacterized protein n=1 Tax=Penicillium riverlandense TaxID=1903569 RepID=UPI002547F18A|nr:uncharacterized protein N7474_005940 [Penicillium riverlandense]KAJ5820349.1 hypothetical protein N7474_005940 [Penicillium riverlandense]